ncbi:MULTISPECIES: hypothetical protein [Acinetobacter calcoaceticus/baumannii complex]|jgi:hypothetical protein|uniref:hypothetical protein n=1 Tax=Acinetobacter calcoaceticus/baumannii complex TaxID=909768 RepID=UPI00112C303F|nr:hypothetical protein [Acinetobacter baumannii]MDC5505997.1 hypothetical protein [Acinetobacter baumannii]TPS34651.1 hypothetical protein FJU48_16635 [Acinetobacter baumannii]UAA84176.1 hypothetical protein H2787_12830 [Acinetobacter baumannii]CAA0222867.1 hypothetical protein ABKPCSM17A_01979 [Acinetobacter baumannii]HEN9571382.1 hypothetical protein [Acinetobacter baumannii]
MKSKIVLTVAILLSSQVFAESEEAAINRIMNRIVIEKNAVINNRVQPKLAKMLGAYIFATGYKCDSISSVIPTDRANKGFTVKCNNYRYSYIVKDRGGNWTVLLDD